MKLKTSLLTLLTAISVGSTTSLMAAEQAQDSLVNEARAMVKQFGGQLKPELKKAMKAGGPVKAVEVCHTKAPQIAHELAQKSGWEINRVSLKARGANAKPDEWEKAVLERFDKQNAMGLKAKEIEFADVVTSDGQQNFRYMKAIGTQGICLKCHGAQVAEPVKQALAKYYPQDQAVGYQKGQIRGAFSFSKAVK